MLDLNASIEREGFTIIPSVVAHENIAALVHSLAQLSLQRSRAGVRHVLRYEPVATLANSRELLAIAQGLLGRGALPFRATLFDKSLQANWLVVWHQDTALPLRERRDEPNWGPWSVKDGVTYAHAPATALSRVLALRVHLNDSTSVNGPLRVLPATHTLGVLTDEAIERLSAQITPVECQVPLGGILAMRPLLVHASSKSRSQMARRVLHIEYAPGPMIADGFELQVA